MMWFNTMKPTSTLKRKEKTVIRAHETEEDTYVVEEKIKDQYVYNEFLNAYIDKEFYWKGRLRAELIDDLAYELKTKHTPEKEENYIKDKIESIIFYDSKPIYRYTINLCKGVPATIQSLEELDKDFVTKIIQCAKRNLEVRKKVECRHHEKCSPYCSNKLEVRNHDIKEFLIHNSRHFDMD